MTALTNRYDFVLLFDVVNGNPNGDPDAGNLPRLDPETNHGLVSDVCLKRKVRNYIEIAKHEDPGFRIYVRDGSVLTDSHREAYKALRPTEAEKIGKESKLSPKDDTEARQLQKFMCENFFDIRSFGAVMSVGINCGQVRGPVQFSFGQSVEPIVPQEITITRMAATNEKEKTKKDAQSESEEGSERTDNRTMGRKYIVPYGLYRAHGFISANLAGKTGFSEEDLGVLWDALANMFEHDRSAARGEMATRKLVVFKHSSPLGNVSAHTLFDRVKIGRAAKGGFCPLAEAEGLPPARAYTDYAVRIEREGLPEGVELIEKV